VDPETDDDTVAAGAGPAGPDPGGDSAEDAAARVEADLARLAGERDEMRALAQQVQADFENFKKQTIRRNTDLVERANDSLLETLLPVLDSFELALGALDDASEQVRKGVELVYAELLGALEKAGLERIEAEGRPFDPNEHEAVLHEEGEGEPVVTDTMRTGYRLKGRVLRPAMVKVAR
jgi:molecular chaperone GrpE